MKNSAPIAPSAYHTLPEDMEAILHAHPGVLQKRNALTPLARNERICRITIVKKEETRQEHLERFQTDLLAGKRRPCCRPGCPHRRPSAKKRFKGMSCA